MSAMTNPPIKIINNEFILYDLSSNQTAKAYIKKEMNKPPITAGSENTTPDTSLSTTKAAKSNNPISLTHFETVS